MEEMNLTDILDILNYRETNQGHLQRNILEDSKN